MQTKEGRLYPNLMAELTRAGLTVIDLSAATGIPYSTLMGKIRGRTDFTMKEAKSIKAVLKVDMPIDELFARVA